MTPRSDRSAVSDVSETSCSTDFDKKGLTGITDTGAVLKLRSIVLYEMTENYWGYKTISALSDFRNLKNFENMSKTFFLGTVFALQEAREKCRLIDAQKLQP